MTGRIPLGDICEFAYGASLKEERREPGKVAVYGSNGIVGWHNQALTGGPTIVIGRKGSFGEVNWSNLPCFPIDTTYFVETTKRPCDLKWLYYALVQLDLTRLNKSAAVPGLNRDDAYEECIVFPGLAEQRRIAMQLEEADRLCRTRHYALEVSDTLLPAAFLEIFGRRLETGPFQLFGELIQITGGGTPSRDRPEYFQGRIPWLTSKDMRGDYIFDTEEHITDEGIKNSATKLVPANSILVVVKSKVLMHRLPVAIAKVAMCHGQDIKSIQCSKELHPEFARFALKYHEPWLLHIARGANTEGLTLPMLEELRLPKVELREQQNFAELVEHTERLRSVQREALRQAEHLFQSLLHSAFAGQEGIDDAKPAAFGA